ncbi:MAG: response regulator [Crenarchaeota archaeon]|nr:MAG: response regulator [Thermoproteota archaeon]RDJ33941.1 MAG: response regulator [Thermoproteota archaeon]RDJ36946.1 MAG: response regulator [Thermoproteota archaeon]RDJ37519.1 MAG: response regulator [Thermoproteota archaeon]
MTSVILIDDEPAITETWEQLFHAKGFDVLGHARNGDEAFCLYKKSMPDFVIMDIMMPKFDGGYGIEKIKTYDPDAKIIVVTAHHEMQLAEKILRYEPVAVIFKPNEMDFLFEIIKKSKYGKAMLQDRIYY